jgi:hypothetical protein
VWHDIHTKLDKDWFRYSKAHGEGGYTDRISLLSCFFKIRKSGIKKLFHVRECLENDDSWQQTDLLVLWRYIKPRGGNLMAEEARTFSGMAIFVPVSCRKYNPVSFKWPRKDLMTLFDDGTALSPTSDCSSLLAHCVAIIWSSTTTILLQGKIHLWRNDVSASDYTHSVEWHEDVEGSDLSMHLSGGT